MPAPRPPAPRREAITFSYYDAGHMFYLNEPDLAKLRRDLLNFVIDTRPTAPPHGH